MNDDTNWEDRFTRDPSTDVVPWFDSDRMECERDDGYELDAHVDPDEPFELPPNHVLIRTRTGYRSEDPDEPYESDEDSDDWYEYGD